MARKRDGGRKPTAEPVEDSSGTLADAISAHLELKQDHGADPDTVEQERQSALAPALRDRDAVAELHSDTSSPPIVPEQVQPIAAPVAPAESTPLAEPVPPAEETEAFEPAPGAELPPSDEPPLAEALPPEPVLSAEDTGNFEFDWAGEAEEPPAGEPAETTEQQPPVSDVLEETPEFFEETPEYDRLWFEERSPRDFDF